MSATANDLPASVVGLLQDLDDLLTEATRALPGGPGPRMRTADVVERLEAIRDAYRGARRREQASDGGSA